MKTGENSFLNTGGVFGFFIEIMIGGIMIYRITFFRIWNQIKKCAFLIWTNVSEIKKKKPFTLSLF